MVRRVVALICLALAALWLVNAVVQAFSGEWTIVLGSVVLAGLALTVRHWLNPNAQASRL